MPVYTVHGPISETARPAPDRMAFVRDGFSFWALLLGPLWLLAHRLWWALLGYAALMIAVSGAMAALDLSTDVRMVINLMIALLMGFEATSLRRWTLSRGRWRQLDIIAAADEDAAERRFFDRWSGISHDREPRDPGAPPPARLPSMRASQREDIIGLFPQPGAAR